MTQFIRELVFVVLETELFIFFATFFLSFFSSPVPVDLFTFWKMALQLSTAFSFPASGLFTTFGRDFLTLLTFSFLNFSFALIFSRATLTFSGFQLYFFYNNKISVVQTCPTTIPI